VSLEKGVCSCAELQAFSCYRGCKEACLATRAISTTSRCELSSSIFFLQDKAPKEIHAVIVETLGEHVTSYATAKHRLAEFKRGDFSTCDAPRPGQPKTVMNVDTCGISILRPLDRIPKATISVPKNRSVTNGRNLLWSMFYALGNVYNFVVKTLQFIIHKM